MTETLEEVTISSIVFDFQTGSITYGLKHRGNIRKVVAKKDFESKFDLKLYRTEYDFVNGYNFTKNRSFPLWSLKEALHNAVEAQVADEQENTFVYSYTLDGGEPVKFDVLGQVATFELKYNTGVVARDEFNVDFIGETPDFEHMYHSKDELLEFESIVIANENGIDKKTDAPMSHLRLDEAQKKAVDEFLKARKALLDAGVGLINNIDNEILAINLKPFKSVESDEPQYSREEYLEQGILRIDSLPGFMRINLNYDGYYNGDSQSVMCIFKEAK